MSHETIFGGEKPQNWLQLFAESQGTGGNPSPDTEGNRNPSTPALGRLPGVSRDNLDDLDDDDDEVDLLAALRANGLLEDDEDDDASEPEAGEAKPEATKGTKPDAAAEGKEPPAQPAAEEKPATDGGDTPKEKLLTQAEVDRIIGERLARERAAINRRVQEATGKTLDQLLEEQRQARIRQAQEQFAMSPQEAEAYVRLQEENARLKAEREELERARAEAEYLRAKAELASKPFFAQFESEIENLYQQFARNGHNVPLSQVYTYVIGQKAANGELQQLIEQAAEQKAIRLAERQKAAPENAGQGTPQGIALPEEGILLAKKLGLKPSELAEEWAKTKRYNR